MPRSSITSRIAHLSSTDAPLLSADQPWWDALPTGFYRHDERFDLHPSDRLPVHATAAADRLIRTGAACLLGTLAMPLGYNPLRLRKLLRERAFYEDLARSGDARLFFPTPRRGVPITTQKAHFARFRPRDGVREDLRFDSPFEPVNPDERKSYLRNRRNRVAWLRMWRHADGPRPTLIAIHGFSADLHLVNEWMFALPWLYQMGVDVALFTLPFHGPRQSRLSPFSGHGFFSGGIARMNEGFSHAVHDLRVFVDHLLTERGVPSVGVTGVSLGGFTSALLAATEPRLSCAIPNVPVVSLADLVLEWHPMGEGIRAALRAFGLGITDARKLTAVSCPLTYPPVLPRERLMVVGGVGDRLAPPKHARLLWEHWDRCAIHWFPGSHLLHLDRGGYLWQISRFLRGIGMLDADHPRPKWAPEATEEVAR